MRHAVKFVSVLYFEFAAIRFLNNV